MVAATMYSAIRSEEPWRCTEQDVVTRINISGSHFWIHGPGSTDPEMIFGIIMFFYGIWWFFYRIATAGSWDPEIVSGGIASGCWLPESYADDLQPAQGSMGSKVIPTPYNQTDQEEGVCLVDGQQSPKPSYSQSTADSPWDSKNVRIVRLTSIKVCCNKLKSDSHVVGAATHGARINTMDISSYNKKSIIRKKKVKYSIFQTTRDVKITILGAIINHYIVCHNPVA